MRRAVMALLAAAVLCGCGAAEPDDNARGRLTDGGGNTVSSGNPETGGSSAAGGNTGSGKTGTNGNAGIPGGLSDKFDPSLVSDEYLVGFDYFTGDFLEYAPTVIAKVRYDGRLEVGFNHTLSNGDPYVETMLFDLSDQQYQNIESEINLKKLYELDPEEPDPQDVCDGGCSYLFIYDKDGNTYIRIRFPITEKKSRRD